MTSNRNEKSCWQDLRRNATCFNDIAGIEDVRVPVTDPKEIPVIWDHFNGKSTMFSVIWGNEIAWSFGALIISLVDQGRGTELSEGPVISKFCVTTSFWTKSDSNCGI
jgi:hypothetical protein